MSSGSMKENLTRELKSNFFPLSCRTVPVSPVIAESIKLVTLLCHFDPLTGGEKSVTSIVAQQPDSGPSSGESGMTTQM